MSEVDKLKRLVELATKRETPRNSLVDELLRHIAAADAASFVEVYEREQPSAGEILRVINRYSKALRALRAK